MKKVLQFLLMFLGIGSIFFLPVHAGTASETEEAELSLLMKAEKSVEAKQEPDDRSDAVISYESGAIVYVIGETEDGWYKVSYQGKEGYIRKSALMAVDEIDTAGLDAEMEEIEAESKMIVEEVERYRAEEKRSRMWGVVIVLLVAGIFATGVISTVKSGKKERSAREEVGDTD